MSDTPSHTSDRDLQDRLEALQKENRALKESNLEASRMLGTLEKRHEELTLLNRRLSSANATSAELLAEIESRNQELDRTNRRLARANAEAAELMAEIEMKNQEIEALNATLSRANVNAAEMLAEIQEKNTTLNETNRRLARANAEAAELMAEIELKNEEIEKLNRALRKRNEEVVLLSITDPLTGAYNRNYLNRHLPLEMKRAARYGHPLSLILCDIDHFKAINDRHGHQAGDRVLRGFAACLQTAIRDGVDWLVRYGGEEFIIVLPETGIKGGIASAERYRKLVAEKALPGEKEPLFVTASFGVAGLAPPEEEHAPWTVDSLIGRADRNLYRAKRAGRNRVMGED